MITLQTHIKEFVYGATDGVVTTFAIIAGTIGAGLDPFVVLALGISNVLADGFSMAASNFLSERSEHVDDQAPGDNLKEALSASFATFISFVSVGIVPIVPFIIGSFANISYMDQFIIAIIATSCAFLFIGAMRGWVTGRNTIKTSLETLLIGGVAASIAYGVGNLVERLM
jgi:vacuolar iron transporter family protein